MESGKQQALESRTRISAIISIAAGVLTIFSLGAGRLVFGNNTATRDWHLVVTAVSLAAFAIIIGILLLIQQKERQK